MDETRKIYKVMAGEIRDKVEDLCVVSIELIFRKMYKHGLIDKNAVGWCLKGESDDDTRSDERISQSIQCR